MGPTLNCNNHLDDLAARSHADSCSSRRVGAPPGSALTVQPQNQHQVDFAKALRVKQTLSPLPLGRTRANLFHLQDDGPVG